MDLHLVIFLKKVPQNEIFIKPTNNQNNTVVRLISVQS